MKAKRSEKYDFITSLASAKKFHDVAFDLLSEYKKSKRISPTDIFASATNLGLSIELYLKTILIMEGQSCVHGHKLDVLYGKISSEVKKKIKKEYSSSDGDKRHETLYLRARLSGSTETEDKNPPARGVKVEQLIKNNSDIFVCYRYMFERGRGASWEHFYFEYGNLNILTLSLDSIAKEFLSEQQQKVIDHMS